MARRTTKQDLPDDFEEHIVETDVGDEMRTSFLEYAYSVIYSRALPDARDGLKPVQRRILYTMADMGLRPDSGHVKSARVVGEVMGRLHPHGDGAIYDALVRMAQPWSMRLPTIDGHGNFGSPDDSPAAMRYTECRMAPPAMAMTDGILEDTVDFRPNYDSRETEPSVLPAAIPHLIVNGTTGIAVGMATNIAPHNLIEVVQALRHMVKHPDTSVDTLMRFIPGPDLPTGGKIVGLDGVKEAYETGRGTFRMRATARVETLGRRKGIVVTELPYGVGTEKVVERIKVLVQTKKLQGISDIKDLTDREKGMRLVIEVKNGFHPEALLEQLYKQTPLEDSFGINTVALVDGQPRTLGLRELLQVFLDHRFEVVRRRSVFRRGKAADRLHIVQGLLVAILDIDEVIQLIRTSDNTAGRQGAADPGLRPHPDPGRLHPGDAAAPADQVLPHRAGEGAVRAGAHHRGARRDHRRRAAALEGRLRRAGRGRQDLRHPAPYRPARVLRYDGHRDRHAARGRRRPLLRLPVLLRPAGPFVHRRGAGPGGDGSQGRANHDVIVSVVRTTARGEVGVLTSRGRVIRLGVLDLPALPPSANDPHLQGGLPVSEVLSLERGERVLALTALSTDGPGLALGTRQGIVKRVNPEVLTNRDEWEVIGLKDGDEVVGATDLATGNETLCFITSDAQLLHFGADGVRPQGRAGGGMAGVRLAPAASGSSGSAPSTRPPAKEPSSSPPRAPPPPCPAPSPGPSRSRRSASTPARAAPPAASAATGSSRARTPSSSPGPARRRPERPPPAARRSTCPRQPADATAPAPPGPSRSPRAPVPSHRRWPCSPVCEADRVPHPTWRSAAASAVARPGPDGLQRRRLGLRRRRPTTRRGASGRADHADRDLRRHAHP